MSNEDLTGFINDFNSKVSGDATDPLTSRSGLKLLQSSRQRNIFESKANSNGRESLNLFKDEPFLQSRKLHGDISNKGKPWRVQTLNTLTKESRTLNDQNEVGTKCNQVKKSKTNKRLSEAKVHIAACKKTQYSHLTSDQKVMPK